MSSQDPGSGQTYSKCQVIQELREWRSVFEQGTLLNRRVAACQSPGRARRRFDTNVYSHPRVRWVV
jgi:hypothetical protein